MLDLWAFKISKMPPKIANQDLFFEKNNGKFTKVSGDSEKLFFWIKDCFLISNFGTEEKHGKFFKKKPYHCTKCR